MSLDGMERMGPNRLLQPGVLYHLREEVRRMEAEYRTRTIYRPPPIEPQSRLRRWLRILTGTRTESIGAR